MVHCRFTVENSRCGRGLCQVRGQEWNGFQCLVSGGKTRVFKWQCEEEEGSNIHTADNTTVCWPVFTVHTPRSESSHGMAVRKVRVFTRTNNSELSTGRVMVQSGVGDAGVDASVTVSHISDGEAVSVNNKPGKKNPGKFRFCRPLSKSSTKGRPVQSDLSSSGSSPSSLSQVVVGTSVGSCFTLQSNTTEPPLWTTLYSGWFRMRVGSDETAGKNTRTENVNGFLLFKNTIFRI